MPWKKEKVKVSALNIPLKSINKNKQLNIFLTFFLLISFFLFMESSHSHILVIALIFIALNYMKILNSI